MSGGPPPIPWSSHPRYNISHLTHHLTDSLSHLSQRITHSVSPHVPPLPPRPIQIRQPINAVYYPNWRIYKGHKPSSLPLALTTHVFYAFAWVKPSGEVHLSDEWADSQLEVDDAAGCLRSFQQLKVQYDHLKVILSVGGGGRGSEGFAEAAATQEGRERFASTARGLVDEYGLDGIDIDWEHPSDHTEGVNYIHLLQTLRMRMPAPRYTLTSALPAGEWALKHIPLSQAAAYLDFINLMAYDFSGSWVDQTGHHAQLYSPRRPHCHAAALSGDSSVRYYRSRGVPAEKIVLGIPAYGRSFLRTKGVGSRYAGHGGDEGTYEFRELPREGAKEFVDMAIGAAWCEGPGGEWVTYDNEQTVKMKAAYAKTRELGGVFFWTGTGDKDGDGSLVDAAWRALHTG